jgi:peptidoglycan/LPS O-acetylase OafA/YrhL
MSVDRHVPQLGATYYPYIDGLRALAVLSVVVFHLHGAWLPGGFAGVDVFFVISGFVVSASLGNYQGSRFLHFVTAFYARRIRRIFPALIVCLLAVAYASALFVPLSWLSVVNQQTGFYAFFGLSNFILAQSGRDYFAPTTEFNPYTHTWSLAVEEQFYVVFPLLFMGWLAGGRGRRLSIALFAVGALASIAFAAWQIRGNPTAAYFLAPGRFWELAVGVLLCQAISARPEAAQASRGHAIGGAFSLLLLFCSFVWSTPGSFPFPGALLAVLGTAGVIYCLHRQAGLHRLHALLGQRHLVLVGRMSYSLYLWHWPVFVLFRWTVGLDTPLLRVIAVLLAFLLAFASYRLIENPVRDARSVRRLPQAAVIAVGLLCIGASCWMAREIDRHYYQISLSEVSRDRETWYPHGYPTSEDFPGCTAEPEYHDVEGGLLLLYSPKGCLRPHPLRQNSLYVIGDSHALAYEGMLKQYAIRNATTVYAYNNGGCPFISLQPGRDDDDPRCRGYAAAALRDMGKRFKPGDVLFLASLRMARFSDQWVYFGEEAAYQQMLSEHARTDRERAVRAAVEVLRPIAAKGVHIVFEGPKPLFKSPPFRCADWFSRGNPACAPGFEMPRTQLDAFRQPVLQAYAEIARQVPDVNVWDPFPVLCPGETCSAWHDGKPLFLDGDHLSGQGNMLLLPYFTPYVNRMFQKEGSMEDAPSVRSANAMTGK